MSCSRTRPWGGCPRKRIVVERKYVVLLRLLVEQLLQFLQLVRHFRREIVGLRVILGQVVKLPLVFIRRGQRRVQYPRSMRRCRVGVPALVIDAAVGDHFEVLGLACRGRVGVRLVEGVDHAHAFDRFLLDSVDYLRCLDTRRFQDRGHDVDDVVELVAHAANVLDAVRPRDRQALARAAEVRGDLLGPLERRVECPRPRDSHVRVGRRRTPGVVELELLGNGEVQDAVV